MACNTGAKLFEFCRSKKINQQMAWQCQLQWLHVSVDSGFLARVKRNVAAALIDMLNEACAAAV
jgi:hypothetical protein